MTMTPTAAAATNSADFVMWGVHRNTESQFWEVWDKGRTVTLSALRPCNATLMSCLCLQASNNAVWVCVFVLRLALKQIRADFLVYTPLQKTAENSKCTCAAILSGFFVLLAGNKSCHVTLSRKRKPQRLHERQIRNTVMKIKENASTFAFKQGSYLLTELQTGRLKQFMQRKERKYSLKCFIIILSIGMFIQKEWMMMFRTKSNCMYGCSVVVETCSTRICYWRSLYECGPNIYLHKAAEKLQFPKTGSTTFANVSSGWLDLHDEWHRPFLCLWLDSMLPPNTAGICIFIVTAIGLKVCLSEADERLLESVFGFTASIFPSHR